MSCLNINIMGWERAVQIVLAVLVIAGVMAMVWSSMTAEYTVDPPERPRAPAAPPSGAPVAETGDIPQEKEPEKKAAAPGEDKPVETSPELDEQIRKLTSAEVRVLRELPGVEKRLKLSFSQKRLLRQVILESSIEMDLAAKKAVEENDPAVFDEARKKVEADARARLRRFLDPAQLEKIKKLVEQDPDYK